MTTLYTADTPNGKKISIALEELEVPYTVERVDLSAPEHPTPEFLALTPNHKIPVLEDDGLVIWESGAILLHLAEKHGKLLPADPAGRIAAIQYAFFQTGGIGPNIGRLAEQVRKPEGEPKNAEWIERFSAEVDRLLGVIDRILADGRPYLAGEFSIGDIMHHPWLAPLHGLKAPPLMGRERVLAWHERIAERPAVVRGMAIP
ncbi:MAG: glutathione S-transferase family protein [Myxococcota bacterium]